MLEVGNPGLTPEESKSHFSLWAMLAAPLITGNDLSAMTPEVRAILTNREVIAVDQDPLGAEGRRVAKDGDDEVWVRPLKDGGRAVVLLNRGKTAHAIRVNWEDLGYPAHFTASVRDLWAARDLPKATGSFTAEAPPHGVVMVKIEP
jgi:alpha-galactosidase